MDNFTINDHFAAQLLYELTGEDSTDDDSGAAERLSQHLGYGNVVSDNVLTIGDAVVLGQILNACQQNQPVTWIARYPDTGELDGHEKTISGTIRAIVTDKDGATLMLGRDKDVRDGYVWVSATFEHFFPVRDVMSWVADGTFALNYRA